MQKISQGKNVAIKSKIYPACDQILADSIEYFHLLLDYVIFFTVNKLLTRGHDEHDDSTNPGNWLNFITLMLKKQSKVQRTQ